jgi:hypothetical protein
MTAGARAATLHVGSNAAWGIAADLYAPGNPSPILHDIGDGAGNINPGSTLNGLSLPYMYCLDLTHDIYLNTDYAATTFNRNGYILNDDPAQNPASVALTNANGQLTNAGNIAYLMVHFAPLAVSQDQQLALQSAIWAEVYGKNYVLLPNPGFSNSENDAIRSQQAWYLSQIPAGRNANYIADVLWINPTQDGVHYAQCQVGFEPTSGPSTLPTPVPSTLVMTSILVGMFAVVWHCKRRHCPALAA